MPAPCMYILFRGLSAAASLKLAALAYRDGQAAASSAASVPRPH